MPDAGVKILTRSILKTVLYSDLFRYPLTPEEIFQRMETNHVTQQDVDQELDSLVKAGILFRSERLHAIQNDPQLFDNRKAGNHLALKMMPRATKRAQLIYQFPFVRAVLISGSLSKNYANSESDVDFFIVTTQGRLWITRTLLAFFQKIFLLNSRKYFCINYLVDESDLEIEERNIFTATELATLIPICGCDAYMALMRANSWVHQFLPNFHASSKPSTKDRGGLVKKSIEWVLSFPIFNSLERVFMNTTARHWQSLHSKKYPSDQFRIAFKATPHVAKSHPDFHQKRVIELFEKRVAEYFNHFQKTSNG